ncbi:MAG: hypothetical protein P8O07_02515 [Crocinitomicaceae bacterium]|nr:hypothetical protein [Crocinitomicaceae bacterium]
MKRIYLILILSIGLLIPACKKQEPTPVTPECSAQISYASDIATLITTSCATSGCHNAASSSAGFVFENHSQVSNNASIILSVIRHESGFQAMPQGASKWSDEQINNFACWLEQGKLNN